MATYKIKIRDRQTKKVTYVPVEAKNMQEAKAKAIALYGVSHEVL